ncbi:MAG TPA: NF038143 family protein [Desulfatiglandales bacterium]
MGDYNKNKALVLDSEESFARAVALGVIVKRPLSAWHFLLPGMFLFDFLRRSSETRRYSDLFLFPRKLALNGALDIFNGEDRKEILSQIEDDMKHWLVSLNLYSEMLHRKHMDEIDLLVDHYSKLLHAEGNNYPGLVKYAYQARESYEAYLHRLSAAEEEVDHAIAEIRGETKEIMERLRVERVQVMELRTKEVNQIFSRTG